MKKNKLRAGLAVLICVAVLVFAAAIYLLSVRRYVYKNAMDSFGLEGINNLMIVAHPDDESLWAGGELLREDYFVVCLMYGKDEVRSKEFADAMELTGDKFIMFNYGKSDNGIFMPWFVANEWARLDFRDIITYKNWEKIVTHNSEGEYGHIRHKDLSRIVTDICKSNGLTERLYYFGQYYTKAEAADLTQTLDEQTLQKKLELIDVYKSQYAPSIYRHIHMAKFEILNPYERS